MITLRLACAWTLALLLFPTVAFGQHDPQRNAIRHIAVGQFDRADRELQKAEPADSETQFVRMVGALAQGRTDEAVGFAKAAIAAGLPFERLVAGPRDALAPLYDTKAWQEWSAQQGPARLVHGPMLGSVTHDGASFWVRTARAANVQVNVFSAASTTPVASSEPRTTSEASDFTTVVRVGGLRPATEYRYQLLVDGEQVEVENSRLTTFPLTAEPAAFHIVFGGGAGFVPESEYMWDTIKATRPAALLTLGDNVYIDDPTQPLTNRYCYYRRQSRPEWRRLAASTSVFSIYDDHDFGLNDCVPGPEIENPPWKRQVWNIFRQNWVNPYYGGGEEQPGCWHDFYIGDVHFILLDGRYYRTLKSVPSMLGPVQKAWLKETLKNSRGTFKVLASPVPWTEGVKPGSRDTWDGFPEEREEIFSFLETNRINGVLLIAADRHRSDLRMTRRPQGYDLYEFESSKLTNRHTHPVVKTPGLIWGYNKTCSFGLIRFDTTESDPRIMLELMTIDGERAHEHELKLSQLTHRER